MARAMTPLKKGDRVMISGGQAEVYAVVQLVSDDGAITATQAGGTAMIAEPRQVRRATPDEVARGRDVK